MRGEGFREALFSCEMPSAKKFFLCRCLVLHPYGSSSSCGVLLPAAAAGNAMGTGGRARTAQPAHTSGERMSLPYTLAVRANMGSAVTPRVDSCSRSLRRERARGERHARERRDRRR